MAKKVIKVEESKKSDNKLDIGKITKTIMDNGEAIEKIVDGISDLMNDDKKKTTATKKNDKSKKSTKNTKKANSDDLSKVINIVDTILKK